MLLASILVTLVVGAVFYFLLGDVYTASASLYVLPRAEDGAGGWSGNDIRELFAHSTVMENTAAALDMDTLRGQVTLAAATVGDTRIVQVTATGGDAALCASAANVASRIFGSYIKDYMKAEEVSVTQAAAVPDGPLGPPRPLVLALVFAGSMLVGMLLAGVIRTKSARIRDARQIDEALHVPVLGRVRDYACALRAFGEARYNMGPLYEQLSAEARDDIRGLAHNLECLSVDQPLRTLTITSATAGEGKSTLAVLLAGAFAEEGKRVLLIDMSARNPSIGALVKTRNSRSLMDFLTERAPLRDVVVPTSIGNVYFIDSNHSDAMLPYNFDSERFELFLGSVCNTFDIILCDTPPLGDFDDAASLAPRTDGTLLVLAAGRVRGRTAQGALEKIRMSGARTLGAVLTMAKPERATSARRREARACACPEDTAPFAPLPAWADASARRELSEIQAVPLQDAQL